MPFWVDPFLDVRMYAEDAGDVIILPPPGPFVSWPGCGIKQYIKSYAGLKGKASPSEKLFICPADHFYYNGHFFGQGLCEQARFLLVEIPIQDRD